MSVASLRLANYAEAGAGGTILDRMKEGTEKPEGVSPIVRAHPAPAPVLFNTTKLSSSSGTNRTAHADVFAPSLTQGWLPTVSMKQVYFHTVVQHRMGLVAQANKNYGESVARMKVRIACGMVVEMVESLGY